VLRIEKLLSREIGLLAQSLGNSAIESAVQQRMVACQADSLDEYVERLEESSVERRALVEDVVVSETWFFRDEKVFEALSEYASGRFRRAHPEGCLRVLSVPCATGEEPYSIAITLLEAGLPPGRFTIQGIDVSARPLEAARLAIYGKNSFRGESTPARERHFEKPKRGDGLEVSELARRSVTFAVGNVLDPFLVPASMHYDVIFCRNLLIYLDAAARTRAFDNLVNWLSPDGVLFSGHAEAIEMMDERFVRMNEAGRCAYVRRRSGAAATTSVATGGAPAQSGPTPRAPLLRLAPTRATPARAPRGRPAVAAVELQPPSSPQPLSLDRVTDLANRGDAGALAACERYIAEAGPSSEAYCLLGVIHMTAGNGKAAMEAFGRALYLDQTHYQSLIHLALLHEQRGETAQAGNLRKRAAREQHRRASR
jgi:chemotaxis protein methyltransferase WspC